MNVSQKLIHAHLLEGSLNAGTEIAVRVDQTLTQDATGTLVMLELEAMNLQQICTELSVQYIDHNLIQEDFKNPDDHLFLHSACRRFGLWYSRPGNGVSHIVHMQHFGKPGKLLLGADSHTCAAGSMAMLAIGSGGLEVALAMAGKPFYFIMPKIWGIKLINRLPDWVSAKDIILEMLRRHGVSGGIGYILEYYGPGLRHLSAMDRHVIANMGAELGATSSVFPADENTLAFLSDQNRRADYQALSADMDASYDRNTEIDLSTLEPLIALPSSPGNVVPVREVAGLDLYQAYIGSSANPGFRDYAMCALMVKDQQIPAGISLDINPSSRNILEALIQSGLLAHLIHAGARLHQAGCNGCIGMGQAPATGKNSLRTVPRNFPGRSGTAEDSVYLCSPETATASALRGKITDPRTLTMPYPVIKPVKQPIVNEAMLEAPLSKEQAKLCTLKKGPNIKALPDIQALTTNCSMPILLKLGHNMSTDDILPAGLHVLPYRSNIPKISEFCFERIDPEYTQRARSNRQAEGHILIAGENYGQGSSREHAALAPHYLGLKIVIALSFARIHWQNLINHGILPLNFAEKTDYEQLVQGDRLTFTDIYASLARQPYLTVQTANQHSFRVNSALSARQIAIIQAGGIIHQVKQQHHAE